MCTASDFALPILPLEQSSHEDAAGIVGAAEGAFLMRAPPLAWPPPSTEALLADGAVLSHDVLSVQTAARALAHCEQKLDAANAAMATGSASERAYFGPVLARHSRRDMRLALEPALTAALTEAASTIGPMLREVLDCADPFLAECGALMSTDGAPRQPLHADTHRSAAPVLLTAFIALQDIDEEMGPTTFLPATHEDESAHAALRSPEEKAALLARGRRVGTMPAGACTLYDSRLIHAGGANRSPRARWLLYAGWCPSRSMARELRGEMFAELQSRVPTLSDFVPRA